MLPTLNIDEFLLKLQAVRPGGNGWMAQCPAHDDHTPSLSVSIGRNGGILAKCQTGCSFTAICHAMGLEPGQLCAPKADRTPIPRIIKTYDYKDALGVLQFQVCRFEPKDFRQRRPDGAGGWVWNMHGVDRVPYRLNDLKGHPTIYVAEGEKDCDALWEIGLPATTNVGGGGKRKWQERETLALKAMGVTRVIAIPDNDDTGRAHVAQIATQMKANAIACTILELPGLRKNGDVSDWLAQGHQRAELEELSAKPYIVQTAPVVPSHTIDDELARLRHYTSPGQAELFAARCGAEFRYNHFRQVWLHYEPPCWRPDAIKDVHRAVMEFVRAQQRAALDLPLPQDRAAEIAFTMKAESSAKIADVIDCATWNLTFADRGDHWDTDPLALAVNNGVVNLRTGVLRAGHPDDRITLKCSVNYNASAQCPRWWQFLSEIFAGDEEVIEFVWRLCGYILTGLTIERIVPMLYGRGANGKSVFLGVLATILGDYALTLPFASLQLQQQESIPNDLAQLPGRRLVTMIEANEGLRLNEAKLKALSGNDRISARFLHGEFFEFQPVAKFVLAMNHKPIAKDDSPAFWERIRLVPFLQTFPVGARDESLQATLIATEGEGILAWAVEGCLKWQAAGLTRPASVIEATAEYKVDSDQLAEFLATCCSLDDPNAVTGAGDLQKAYNRWAENRGLSKFEKLSSHALGRRLAERFNKKITNKGPVYYGISLIRIELW